MREMSIESLGNKPEKLTPSSHTAVVKVGSPWKRRMALQQFQSKCIQGPVPLGSC